MPKDTQVEIFWLLSLLIYEQLQVFVMEASTRGTVVFPTLLKIEYFLYNFRYRR